MRNIVKLLAKIGTKTPKTAKIVRNITFCRVGPMDKKSIEIESHCKIFYL